MSHGQWLSKSRIQSGRQCRKRLWLEINERAALRWTDAAQARLDEGTRFGEVARLLLGDGVLVEADHLHASEALAETNALLERPRADAPLLFEPAFAYEGVRVRVDAFAREDRGDTLIEVKSSTAVKREYLWDCAIQTWVARGSGRNVRNVRLGLVNTGFRYSAEGDFRGLLKVVDVTEEVESLLPRIPEIVDSLKHVGEANVPEIYTGEHCFEPYGCPFLARCRADEPAAAEFPIGLLPRARSLISRLTAAGYRDLREVPDPLLTNPVHRRIASVTSSGVPFIAEELSGLLSGLPYPRAYLDFETIAFIVPRWIGTRPFQQLPFQFSCHIEREDGELRHASFLDTTGASPLRPIALALLSAVDGAACIPVWNRAFEAGRVVELAEHLPELAPQLLSIVDRMVDLLPLYRRHYYHRDMRGSWSIKAVLPTVAPELAYASLDVADGGAAQSAWLRASDSRTPASQREALQASLLQYCERDTLAMVCLAHAFDRFL